MCISLVTDAALISKALGLGGYIVAACMHFVCRMNHSVARGSPNTRVLHVYVYIYVQSSPFLFHVFKICTFWPLDVHMVGFNVAGTCKLQRRTVDQAGKAKTAATAARGLSI